VARLSGDGRTAGLSNALSTAERWAGEPGALSCGGSCGTALQGSSLPHQQSCARIENIGCGGI